MLRHSLAPARCQIVAHRMASKAEAPYGPLFKVPSVNSGAKSYYKLLVRGDNRPLWEGPLPQPSTPASNLDMYTIEGV